MAKKTHQDREAELNAFGDKYFKKNPETNFTKDEAGDISRWLDGKPFFNHELLNRTKIHNGRSLVDTSGSHPITSHGLRHHLNHGSVSFLTAENPMATKLSPEENRQRTKQLENEMKGVGAIYHGILGHYGGNPEHSFMVHHTNKITPEVLEGLARKYGQESILHTSLGRHKLKYVNGENEGLSHPGEGYLGMGKKIKSNFSQPENKPKDRFSANIDFGRLVKKQNRKILQKITVDTEDEGPHEIEFSIDHGKIEE